MDYLFVFLLVLMAYGIGREVGLNHDVKQIRKKARKAEARLPRIK